MPFDPAHPVHIYVPGDPADPRDHLDDIPGLVVHRGPALHPDDLTTVRGLPVTSASRTLIDCAECMTEAELRQVFRNAQAMGDLDPEALRAARARVEWRPSLELVDRLIAEFT